SVLPHGDALPPRCPKYLVGQLDWSISTGEPANLTCSSAIYGDVETPSCRGSFTKEEKSKEENRNKN
ncbi:hypothetical protein RUM43_002677, partial [Polyplax serrata]